MLPDGLLGDFAIPALSVFEVLEKTLQVMLIYFFEGFILDAFEDILINSFPSATPSR